jgi:glycosyltransferase involved in cell wall biosynthesis
MFLENRDGATKALYALTESLLNRSIEVGIWAFSITPQAKNGLSLYTIPSVPIPVYPDYRISLPNRTTTLQLSAFNPDVIHVAVPDLAGVFLMRYAKANGIPVLMSFHTDFPSYLRSYKLAFLRKPLWKYLKWFYGKSASVMAPNTEVIGMLNRHGIHNTKLWARGIHHHQYNPAYRSETLRRSWGADGRKVILYCGRFVWYKDLDLLMQVYDYFNNKGPNGVVFVLVGDGPIKEILAKRMPDAHFPGYLVGEELSRAYASSDVFLFPSTTEAFGNVALEAIASGLPAVVSDRGGCMEIVRKSGAGLIARAGNSRDLYDKCLQLLTDEPLAEEMRQKGLNYAKEQDWEIINGHMIREYQHLTTPRQ